MLARWISPRALAAHAGAVIAVGACGAAARWQIHRAAEGNLLSWAYAVEWPLFAIASIVLWWQFLHNDRRPGGAGPVDQGPPPQTGGRPLADPVDDPELRAYNDELAALAQAGRRKSWRNPRGSP